MAMKFVITPQGANIWADGKVFTVPSSHPRWPILSLAFKDKNEALVAWVLNDSVKALGLVAAESDERFVPEGSWLSWQPSDSELPAMVPTSWKPAVDSWVTAGYDLVPLARFLARSTPAQWELATLVVGTSPVFDYDGNLLVAGTPHEGEVCRLGRGAEMWADPSTLAAPRGYVEAVSSGTPVLSDKILRGHGRIFSRATAAEFALEKWTGKMWQTEYRGPSLIQALDQVDTVKETASKTRVRATLPNGVTLTVWAELNADYGFQVTHQPEGKSEVVLANVFILPDAQAIARHIQAPGHLRIKRNGTVLAERMI